MLPLFTMWQNTRMVVLVALSAALYAALLIPFKFATVIPGLTEIRPGVCVPVVTGILFGPAACWGSAMGNVIGDVIGGQFGPGSFFGFCGNFVLSFVSWKLWEAFRFEDERYGRDVPDTSSGRGFHWHVIGWVVLCLTASAACALILGWGVDMLGIVPFAFLAVVVFLNDAVVSLLLAPALLAVLRPRATRWGLRYHAIMDVPPTARLGPAIVLAVAAIGGFVILLGYTTGVLHVPMLDPTGQKGTAVVTYGALPFLALMLIAMILL